MPSPPSLRTLLKRTSPVTGWPAWGYEVQVNNSHSVPSRTASLLGIQPLQGHEAGSEVHRRSIKMGPLPAGSRP